MATWRAVEHHAEHDTVIDEVTVAWQGLRTRDRFGDVLTVQELRETRDAALFHEAAATTLGRSTLTRTASHVGAATIQCADDLGLDLEAVVDSVNSHHIALAAVTGRLVGEHLADASVASLKTRILGRTPAFASNPDSSMRPARGSTSTIGPRKATPPSCCQQQRRSFATWVTTATGSAQPSSRHRRQADYRDRALSTLSIARSSPGASEPSSATTAARTARRRSASEATGAADVDEGAADDAFVEVFVEVFVESPGVVPMG